ncbi:MAG: TonB-dependent receptor plug domain-containing protein [Longimicrobiales bacterium]
MKGRRSTESLGKTPIRARALLLSCLYLVLATPVSGQRVLIVGRVIDDISERTLSQVDVQLRAPDGTDLGRYQTDGTGKFEFTVRGARAVRLHASLLGYRASTTPLLYLDEHKFFQLEVRLDPQAILLAPLEVIAWSKVDKSALLDGFRQRLRIGFGTYITRRDVERRNPVYVTDLLREIPGLRVTGEGYGSRPVVETARSAGRSCATQIFVDGFLLNRRTGRGRTPADFRIDDAVSPASIEGIEVYQGGSTVPAEFLNVDAACGVIAIWTRRGGA